MAFAVSFKLLFTTLITLLPISATAQSSSNVTSGSFIVADNANSTWKSPSGEFAFGFRQVAPGGYLLAIWFDKIPEKTIVWSANRDKLTREGSRIQLLADGRFQLYDPRGQQVWAANFVGSGAAYGAMLDTGNFVLARNTSAVVWRSFDEPTDTLLPGQIFSYGNLVSSFSDTNYSKGRFMFTLQTDGNLVLYTRNFPMDDTVFAYWSSSTVNSGFELIFNQSGYIYLVAENGTILITLFSNGASTSHFYQRLILEYDGVLRHYVYPKSASSGGARPMAWAVDAFLPSNICIRIEGQTGGGACGFNSICSLGDDRRPNCGCPFGYSLRDPTAKLSGCKPNFVPQSCDRESNETEHFSLRDMPNTDWPNGDYAHFQRVAEDWCRQACLGDCFCAVAVYIDGNCWMKSLPLSNGRIDPSVMGKALLKIRKDNTTTPSPSGF